MEKKTKRKAIIGVIVGIILLAIIILLLLKGCQSKEYEVTFDANGGNVVESIHVKENGQIKKPTDPTREGYEFIGWYYNGKLFDFSKKITKDMKLEARWSKALQDISIANMTLKVGQSDTIKVSLEPSDVTVELVYSSSDSSIVSIDQNGKVTAKKAGKVTITVKTKDGKHQASCEITVEEEKEEEANDTTASNKPSSNKNSSSNKPSSQQPSNPQPSNPQPVQDSYSIVIVKRITKLGTNFQNKLGVVNKNGSAFYDYTDIVINGNYFGPGEVMDSSIAPSYVTIMRGGTVLGTATVIWTEETV